MTTYRATLTATFAIEAENIVQAKIAAKSIKSIGERFGAKRGLKDRDFMRYRITRLSEAVALATLAPSPKETTGEGERLCRLCVAQGRPPHTEGECPHHNRPAPAPSEAGKCPMCMVNDCDGGPACYCTACGGTGRAKEGGR